MSSVDFAPQFPIRRRISLAHIDAVVSARLGPTRGLGNSQPAAFNRQVAMYMAKHIGRWTTTVIGRFYNGRDHSTVCYCVHKVASLSKSNPEVAALVAELKQILENPSADLPAQQQMAARARLKLKLSQPELESLVDELVERVYSRIRDRFNTMPQDQPQAHAHV